MGETTKEWADRLGGGADDGGEQPLTVTVEGGVAVVRLYRPGRANAVDRELGDALESAFVALAADPQVRVVVVTGGGGHFCAGGDVARLDEILADGGAQLNDKAPEIASARFSMLGEAAQPFAVRYLLPQAIGKPVIAAIEGVCAGVGLVLALACDLRVAAADARFAASFAERGLVAESAITVLVERIAGAGMAARLLIACERIDGAEAHRCHLVERLAAPGAALEEALGLARDIATRVSPRSATVIKRQIQRQSAPAFARAVRDDHEAMMASFAAPDFAEGLASFSERRPPRFADWQETP